MDTKAPLAVGIDLGTTYSCISYIDEFGKAVVLKNFEGDAITPSVVYFPEGSNEVVVGKEAKNNKMIEPEWVVDYIKRSMGKINAEKYIGEKSYRPEEISAFILKKILKDAAEKLGRPITHAVVTCPAYFGINEREATAQAGFLSGLQGYSDASQPNVIPEPVAAAFYYGLEKSGKDEVILVFDLGGGTFDATLLEIKNGSVQTICIGGDHELGGKDWDDALVNYCLEEAREAGADLDNVYRDLLTLGELHGKVEDAKKSLTAKEKTIIGLTIGGIRQRIEMTRDIFDALTEPQLERTITLCREMLSAANEKGYASFDRILLVGGSTKMPQIQRRLSEEFPGVPIDFNEPDESVAKGAALFAQKLMIDKMVTDELFKLNGNIVGNEVAQPDESTLQAAQNAVADTLGLPANQVARFHQTELSNITSKSFGIVVVENGDAAQKRISNLVKLNTTLPAEVSKEYCTIIANQPSANIHIMENRVTEDLAEMENGMEVGNAVLDLPEGLPKGARVEVRFHLDSGGLLQYSGRDVSSGNIIQGEVKTTAVMNAEELAAAAMRVDALMIT